jgi:hypothetical protein
MSSLDYLGGLEFLWREMPVPGDATCCCVKTGPVGLLKKSRPILVKRLDRHSRPAGWRWPFTLLLATLQP